MKNVKYVGTSDFREVDDVDFDRHEVKAGAEESKLQFAQGEVKEVTNEVADFLLEHSTFYGEFEELTDKEAKADEEADQEAEKKAEEDAAAAAAAGTKAGKGAAATTRPPTTGGSAGSGSSTSGSPS